MNPSSAARRLATTIHSRFAKIRLFGHVTNAHLVFWLALPVVWAMPTIYYNVNMAPTEMLPLAEVFTLLHMFIMWGCSYIATRGLSHLTRKHPIKPVFILFLGGLIGILILARPLLRASVALRAEWFASTEEVSRQILDAFPSYFELSPGFLFSLVSIYWFRIFCWTASAWFFYSFFGKPSFGIDTAHFKPLDHAITTEPDASKTGDTNQTPQFMSKVTTAIGKDLVALKAEGHYVRVYTQIGNDLIYYRFSDAIAQLNDHTGIQVHRSYWINSGVAHAVKDEAGKYELHLPNGLKVPIGQTYKQNVRAAGLLP